MPWRISHHHGRRQKLRASRPADIDLHRMANSTGPSHPVVGSFKNITYRLFGITGFTISVIPHLIYIPQIYCSFSNIFLGSESVDICRATWDEREPCSRTHHISLAFLWHKLIKRRAVICLFPESLTAKDPVTPGGTRRRWPTLCRFMGGASFGEPQSLFAALHECDLGRYYML